MFLKPGPVVLEEMEAALASGAAVQAHLRVYELVRWAHREHLDEDDELLAFYQRIIDIITLPELRRLSNALTLQLSEMMEEGFEEMGYDFVAGRLGILGAISCLGIVPDLPTRRRFESSVSEFTRKRYRRGQLSAAIYGIRDEDPLWGQPICQLVTAKL